MLHFRLQQRARLDRRTHSDRRLLSYVHPDRTGRSGHIGDNERELAPGQPVRASDEPGRRRRVLLVDHLGDFGLRRLLNHREGRARKLVQRPERQADFVGLNAA